MEVGTKTWRFLFFDSPTDGISHLETCPNYSLELVCHFLMGKYELKHAKHIDRIWMHLAGYLRLASIGNVWLHLGDLGINGINVDKSHQHNRTWKRTNAHVSQC